ncbi:MAG TPA: HAD-IA family hydrolase [Candidatus Hydrogenedentes bacterium]|nr:HAD-IA family hydrolase [Candidatus Hydrogenedentota bacterium]HOS01472.1 HAD-IA family hydrolase [Candidatus Hydrogenedentota bacterium]
MACGLLFDMDGVLADTEAIIAEATIQMYRDLYGVTLEPKDFLPFVGTGAVRYTQGPADAAGFAIDLDKALEVRYDNFVALLNSGRNITFPGVLDLIDAAYASPDWDLAIATSSPGPKAMETLAAAKIPVEKFTKIISGDMVTHKKPHPEIYLRAATELGIEPACCAVIEDAIEGVKAAKAAGMPCLAVTNTFPREQLFEADLVVNSLADVDLQMLCGLLP